MIALPGGVDRGGRIDVALDLAHVHVGGVHCLGRDTVVVLVWKLFYVCYRKVT